MMRAVGDFILFPTPCYPAQMLTICGLNVNGFNKSRRGALEELFRSLAVDRPDFICLQETRGKCSEFLERFCREEGYFLEASYDSGSRASGVAILATHKFVRGQSFCREDIQVTICRDAFEGRFLEVRADGLKVTSVYAYSVPDNRNKNKDALQEERDARLSFYQCLGRYMHENADSRVVIATDLNLCLSRYDAETDEQWKTDWASRGKQRYQEPILKELDSGWTDVWRRVHGTERRKETVWTANNFATPEGYGIDHQLVSRPLASFIMSADLRKPDAYKTGFSDHALTVGVFAISAD